MSLFELEDYELVTARVATGEKIVDGDTLVQGDSYYQVRNKHTQVVENDVRYYVDAIVRCTKMQEKYNLIKDDPENAALTLYAEQEMNIGAALAGLGRTVH